MLNIIAVVGRLTATPELKFTINNLAVSRFSVAVSRSFVAAGKERQTDFIDAVAWKNQAEFLCKYFTKGQLVAVEGSLQTRTYTDNNGNNRKVSEIIANNIHFVESKGSNSGNFSEKSDNSSFSSSTDEEFTNQNSNDSEDSDDDLPF